MLPYKQSGKQFAELKRIITEWVRKIQPSPLSNSDKLVAYKDCIDAKLLYVLPLCFLTYIQCKELDKLLSLILLNSHGFQRHSNRNILYTSEELGGLSIFSVYHLQGQTKLQILFKHYREHDTTGNYWKLQSDTHNWRQACQTHSSTIIFTKHTISLHQLGSQICGNIWPNALCTFIA